MLDPDGVLNPMDRFKVSLKPLLKDRLLHPAAEYNNVDVGGTSMEDKVHNFSFDLVLRFDCLMLLDIEREFLFDFGREDIEFRGEYAK
eukprot:CAMPEP_0184679582 /NCGR_PEP_ID=MMETSP0312-20130426/2423_1 /TAXON_ID=31354 /ORGANISM="Compsopogon coeruleus, Strain SAG 36.94" /LENGTH=87 /DNA_ID=CAMNT_0027129113 /DNA_START=103 /DNA_END=366 /DNA_ORIENTATION=+